MSEEELLKFLVDNRSHFVSKVKNMGLLPVLIPLIVREKELRVKLLDEIVNEAKNEIEHGGL